MTPVCLEPPPELAGYNCWYVATRGLRFLIKTEIVSRIQADILQSVAHGRTLAGTLFGTFVDDDSPAVIIDDVQYLEPGKSDGRSSAEEANVKSESNPLGYFRADAGDLALDSADLAFLQQHLPIARSMILLVRPYPVGICMAGVFFRAEDGSLPAFPDLEVAFIPHEPSGLGSPGITEAAPEPVPVSESPDSSQSAAIPLLFEFEQPPSRRPRTRLAIAAVVAAVVFAALVAYVSRGKTTAALPTGAELGASAETGAGGKVLLRWNRNHAAFSEATGGLLTVTDGKSERSVPIPSEELRSGSIVYFRSSAALQLRLEVQLKNGNVLSETLHLPEIPPPPPQKDSTSPPQPRPAVSTPKRPRAPVAAPSSSDDEAVTSEPAK